MTPRLLSTAPPGCCGAQLRPEGLPKLKVGTGRNISDSCRFGLGRASAGFSAFAADALQRLAAGQPGPAAGLLRELLSGFSRYRALSPAQRRQLLAEAEARLQAAQSEGPLRAHPAAPAAAAGVGRRTSAATAAAATAAAWVPAEPAAGGAACCCTLTAPAGRAAGSQGHFPSRSAGVNSRSCGSSAQVRTSAKFQRDRAHQGQTGPPPAGGSRTAQGYPQQGSADPAGNGALPPAGSPAPLTTRCAGSTRRTGAIGRAVQPDAAGRCRRLGVPCRAAARRGAAPHKRPPGALSVADFAVARLTWRLT